MNEDCIIIVRLVLRSNFRHLTLDNDSKLLTLLVVRNGHALVLVVVSYTSIVLRMAAGSSDNPAYVTIITEARHDSLIVDFGVIRLSISPFVRLVVTTEEQLIITSSLANRVDAAHLIKLSMPPYSTITLVEADDTTKAAITTNQVELGLLLRISDNEVRFLLIEERISCNLTVRVPDETVVPVNVQSSTVGNSEHEHGIVLYKSSVEVRLVISVVALIVEDGTAESVCGHNRGRSIDIIKGDKSVESTVRDVNIHEKRHLVAKTSQGK